jgi:hypothetical protein
MLDQPALRFGGIAVAGAIAGSYLNGNARTVEMLSPLNFGGKLQTSTIAAVLTMIASWFFLKGKNRAVGLAAGAGMLVPQAQSWASGALNPASSADQLRVARSQRPRSIPAPRGNAARSVAKYNRDLIGA